MDSINYTEKFSGYFSEPQSIQASKPLKDGSEMEFQVLLVSGETETFTFRKDKGCNHVFPDSAVAPQIIFKLTERAANQILERKTTDIGQIGINIAKLIITTNKDEKISIQLKAGFLELFNKGYFGVIKTGGSAFTTFMASRGLKGMNAIKTVLKKLRGVS